MGKWFWSLLYITIFSCNPPFTGNLDFEPKDFHQKACHGKYCSEVNVTFPFFIKENEPSLILNKLIEEKIIELIEVNEEVKVVEIGVAATNFLDSYIGFMEEFQSNQEWEINITVRVLSENFQLISIVVETYSYTGGAHPNSYRQYLNFDKFKNKELENEYFILDRPGLLNLVELKFRKIHEVEDGITLKETGKFFLEKDSLFFLPSAIGFEMDSLVFFYNPYEIGPYVMGGTEVKLAKEELKGVVDLFE